MRINYPEGEALLYPKTQKPREKGQNGIKEPASFGFGKEAQ